MWLEKPDDRLAAVYGHSGFLGIFPKVDNFGPKGKQSYKGDGIYV